MLAAAACVVALTVRTARLYVLLLAVDICVLLLSPSFYVHYASLTTPMLALVVGVAVGRMIGLVRLRGGRVVLVAVIACMLILAGVPRMVHGINKPIPAGAVAAVRAVPGCVMAEDPTLLVVTNVLTRDLERGWPPLGGCAWPHLRPGSRTAS